MKLARGLKFQILKLEVLYYPGSEQNGADRTARMRRLICAIVVRIWQNRFSHDGAQVISEKTITNKRKNCVLVGGMKYVSQATKTPHLHPKSV